MINYMAVFTPRDGHLLHAFPRVSSRTGPRQRRQPNTPPSRQSSRCISSYRQDMQLGSHVIVSSATRSCFRFSMDIARIQSSLNPISPNSRISRTRSIDSTEARKLNTLGFWDKKHLHNIVNTRHIEQFPTNSCVIHEEEYAMIAAAQG